MIATTTTVAFVVVTAASSTSHATATANSKSSSSEAAVDVDALPPSFLHHHEDHVDAADTGILSMSRRLLSRARRAAIHDSKDNKTTADASSLSSSFSSKDLGRRELVGPAWCTEGYVDCVNGYIAGTTNFIPDNSCTAACIDSANPGPPKCCYGKQACTGFTGKVCKDGTSCMGPYACLGAKNIPQVKNSCQGNKACKSVAAPATGVGGVAGTVGNIINSCNGDYSCYALGFNGGTVGYIESSCTARHACNAIALDGGTVGNIKNSCTAYKACRNLCET